MFILDLLEAAQRNLFFFNKLKFSNPYIFATGWCKSLIFQIY